MMQVNLTKDEVQTIANTLYEFVYENKHTITRKEELKKIERIYKKLYLLYSNGLLDDKNQEVQT